MSKKIMADAALAAIAFMLVVTGLTTVIDAIAHGKLDTVLHALASFLVIWVFLIFDARSNAPKIALKEKQPPA